MSDDHSDLGLLSRGIQVCHPDPEGAIPSRSRSLGLSTIILTYRTKVLHLSDRWQAWKHPVWWYSPKAALCAVFVFL